MGLNDFAFVYDLAQCDGEMFSWDLVFLRTNQDRSIHSDAFFF